MRTAAQRRVNLGIIAYPWRCWISPVIRFLFSFEVAFVLFLFAGIYKAGSGLSWVPIDLTALTFGVSVAVGFWVLLRRRFRILRRGLALVLPFLALVAFVGFSLLWSPGSVYATQKAAYVATLVLWPLAATALVIGYDRERVRRLLVALAVFCLLIAGETLLAYMREGGTTFMYSLGKRYLGLSRMLGLGALLSLAYLLFFADARWKKVLTVGLIGLLFALLFVAGGRGPLVATVLVSAALLPAGLRLTLTGTLKIKRYVIPLVTVLALAVIAATYLLTTGRFAATLDRLVSVFGPNVDASTAVRVGYYEPSLLLWVRSPLWGHGIGSWPVLMGLGDVRGYPHNIILELLDELGLVGLMLFVVLIVTGIKSLGSWKSMQRDPIRIVVLMLFGYGFLNALLSGDIADNRMLFGMIGMMALSRGRGA